MVNRQQSDEAMLVFLVMVILGIILAWNWY